MRLKKKELRKALIDADMNQRALAKKLGCSDCNISNLFQRSVSEKKVQAIANAIGVDALRIAEYEEVMK